MKILVVTGRYPWPPRRGDQLRAAQGLKALCPVHEVRLLAPARGLDESPPADLVYEGYRAASIVARLARLLRAAANGTPLENALLGSADLARRLRRAAPEADCVLLQLARLEPWVKHLGERPLIVDLIDSLSLSAERRAARERRLLAPLWHEEARRLARCERRLIARSRAILVVGERDRAHLARGLPGDLAARLRVVPLAVEPIVSVPSPPAGRGRRLIVSGNLGYFPTSDGVRFLLRSVWPQLRGRRPELELTLAGDRPTRALQAEAAAAGARLVAAPRSLAGELAASDVALVPLFAGAGVPIKLLEAWAAGVAVVASPWAAAGAGAVAERDLVVAKWPDEWRREIERLLDAPEERARLAAAGRARLSANAWGPVAAAWRAAVAGER